MTTGKKGPFTVKPVENTEWRRHSPVSCRRAACCLEKPESEVGIGRGVRWSLVDRDNVCGYCIPLHSYRWEDTPLQTQTDYRLDMTHQVWQYLDINYYFRLNILIIYEGRLHFIFHCHKSTRPGLNMDSEYLLYIVACQTVVWLERSYVGWNIKPVLTITLVFHYSGTLASLFNTSSWWFQREKSSVVLLLCSALWWATL